MPLRHTLLGLRSISPMHGYLLRRPARAFSWIYPMANASIYPALHALERDGHVRHRSEIHEGRARKVYAISDGGRAELERWLTDPGCVEPALHDPMLLKIAMQTDETLIEARSAIERALIDLRKQIEGYDRELAARDETEKYTDIVVRYGIDMLRLRMEMLMRPVEAADERLEANGAAAPAATARG